MKLDRILVVDPSPTNAKMMANLLRGINPSIRIYGAQTVPHGLGLARDVNPKLIFVDSPTPSMDGLQFARDLRRSDFACREAPMIMVSSEATAALILGARDAGVHEFLRRPYTLGDVQKRLDAVGKARDWIEAIHYIGPDRRRFNSADYAGPRKRRSDGPPKLQKINQALRIVVAAAGALDTDPVQAARALATQARVLSEVANGQQALLKLGGMAVALQNYLTGAAAQKDALSKSQVDFYAAQLIALAPAEAQPKAA